MNILNLTNHSATPEQISMGVKDPVFKERINSLLTFDGIPTKAGMKSRAEKLAWYAKSEGFNYVMIGGAPYFMSTLEQVCADSGLKVLYAFSNRNVKETVFPDGRVLKEAVFEHKGFYQVN